MSLSFLFFAFPFSVGHGAAAYSLVSPLAALLLMTKVSSASRGSGQDAKGEQARPPDGRLLCQDEAQGREGRRR